MEILLAFAAIYGIYKLYQLANHLISYYDFMFSVKARNKQRFKEDLEKLYPLLGDIELDRYTIEFNTDKFHAPRLGEKVIVCGIEYKCFENVDISDMDDYLKGSMVHKVCLYREDL
jgi:hypothetical protein